MQAAEEVVEILLHHQLQFHSAVHKDLVQVPQRMLRIIEVVVEVDVMVQVLLVVMAAQVLLLFHMQELKWHLVVLYHQLVETPFIHSQHLAHS
jgi:hypothetical protein